MNFFSKLFFIRLSLFFSILGGIFFASFNSFGMEDFSPEGRVKKIYRLFQNGEITLEQIEETEEWLLVNQYLDHAPFSRLDIKEEDLYSSSFPLKDRINSAANLRCNFFSILEQRESARRFLHSIACASEVPPTSRIDAALQSCRSFFLSEEERNKDGEVLLSLVQNSQISPLHRLNAAYSTLFSIYIPQESKMQMRKFLLSFMPTHMVASGCLRSSLIVNIFYNSPFPAQPLEVGNVLISMMQDGATPLELRMAAFEDILGAMEKKIPFSKVQERSHIKKVGSSILMTLLEEGVLSLELRVKALHILKNCGSPAYKIRAYLILENQTISVLQQQVLWQALSPFSHLICEYMEEDDVRGMIIQLAQSPQVGWDHSITQTINAHSPTGNLDFSHIFSKRGG